MRPRKTLEKILDGSKNIPFDDLLKLAEAFGFELQRTRGSHHILSRPGVREILNLQRKDGKAIPYQMNQLLRLADLYGLNLEDER